MIETVPGDETKRFSDS